MNLSTHWNAHRHAAGETMIEEILALGFHAVELGYDLRLEQVEGVQQQVNRGAVRVESIHNFCPVPLGASGGHPELFSLCSRDTREREAAVAYTLRTVELAGSMGAGIVVIHSGNVDMRRRTPELLDLIRTGKQYDPRYEKQRMKLIMDREKKAPRHLEQLTRSLEDLLPVLERGRIVLALENLPSWESVPTELEAESLMRQFNSPWIRCWHDTGHAQCRDAMGFINHAAWLKKLSPWIAGAHIHDFIPPDGDHCMPPGGSIHFETLMPLFPPAIPLVLEPAPGTRPDDIVDALAYFRQIFTDSTRDTGKGT